MSAIDVVGQYGAAAGIGDMATAMSFLAHDAVWHQPGGSQVSGDHRGPEAILAHLGRFMELSAGTFRLETLSATEAGDLVSTTVRFSAQREGRDDLDQHGIDIFRVSNGKIAEIWLISEDQAAEDLFWA